MGRGHGSSRGSGGAKGAGRDGYSAGLTKALNERTEEIQMSRTEHVSIYDKNGNEVFRNDNGTETSVDIEGKYLTDNISIHNHPKGRSFSAGDVAETIENNGAEMRVIGSNGRVYSLKRPKGGWGMTGEQAYEAYNRQYWRNYGQGAKYTSSYKGDRNTAIRRNNITAAHITMKQLAKQYGWDYSYYRK